MAFEELSHGDALGVLGRAPSPEQGAHLSLTAIQAALKHGGRQRNMPNHAREIRAALGTQQLAAPATVTAAFAATTRAAVGIIAELNRQISELEVSSRCGPSRCRSAFAKIPPAGASTRASPDGSSTRGKHPQRTKSPRERPSGAKRDPVDPLHRRQREGGRGQSDMHSRNGAIVNADNATQPLGRSTSVTPQDRSPQRSSTMASAT